VPIVPADPPPVATPTPPPPPPRVTPPPPPRRPAGPPPPGTARVTPVTPSRDPLVERTVVEGTVLDERPDDRPEALPPGLDDLVPDLDDDLDGDPPEEVTSRPAVPAVPAAGDDDWADAWVMDEGPATGDAVGELTDDATVTTPADRSPGRRDVPDPGGWVRAGRPGDPG